jgi:hypothetical protein
MQFHTILNVADAILEAVRRLDRFGQFFLQISISNFARRLRWNRELALEKFILVR